MNPYPLLSRILRETDTQQRDLQHFLNLKDGVIESWRDGRAATRYIIEDISRAFGLTSDQVIGQQVVTRGQVSRAAGRVAEYRLRFGRQWGRCIECGTSLGDVTGTWCFWCLLSARNQMRRERVR